MSEAKREHNFFRHAAAAAAAATPPRPATRAATPAPATTIVELRLVESWEQDAAVATGAGAGADPYNTVGTRVARNPRPGA